MQIPVTMLIDLLEAQMDEAKCDELAKKLSVAIKKQGFPGAKIFGGLVYGAIDAVTPEILFNSLRELFVKNESVGVGVSEEPATP